MSDPTPVTPPPFTLSVLDLSPVSAGSSPVQALQNTLDLARLADSLGYHRYWLAEHHNTAFIASSVPEIMIGHVASVTERIRVGSGGIMLPNHVPLKVAETFRALEALHPDRIDLGIGRAPGTDRVTALALRRTPQALNVEDFPEQLSELLAFLWGGFPDDHPFRNITAMPDGVPNPDIWLLGSSDYSAELAAAMGLGFAFADHIAPAPAIHALRAYHSRFRPSPYGEQARSLIAVSVVCAETNEKAEELARPLDLTLLRLGQERLGRLPSPEEAANHLYTSLETEQIRANRSHVFVGSPTTVRSNLTRLANAAGVRELMVTTNIFHHQDRRRSYELLAEAFSLPGSSQAGIPESARDSPPQTEQMTSPRPK